MSGVVMLILRVVMAVCLYAFIGLVIFLVWKDLRQQADLASRTHTPPVFLRGIEPYSGLSFTLRNSESFIGRDPSCDAFIEDSTLSARHARISYHHKQWWVEDLQSTNGTCLNDHPLLQPAVLESGDRLTCGNISFTIKMRPADS